MEPAGSLSDMQPEAWQAHFPKRVTGRRGQRRAWEYAARTTEDRGLIVQPTGYGKSKTAQGYYAILRARGLVNRLLWIVPTDALREQLIPAKPKLDRLPVNQEAEQFFGVKFAEAVAVEKSSRDHLYNERDVAEIFVTTYQQVAFEDGHFRELMDSAEGRRKWLVVCDEAHHLAEDAKWGPAVHRLPFAHILYLSATPVRTDRKLLEGVPVKQTAESEWTYDAAVEITYAQALEEQAIRRPEGHIEHYFVDAETADGETVRITTELLRREDVADFSSYEARKGLRYCDRFLSTILNDALMALNEKLLRHPRQHQMLVFAMSCKHAEAVAAHFNSTDMEPGCADWIGITRSDKINHSVLERFEANRLKVLVQVDKAGEGFDNKLCSVLVFLHLIRSETKLFQQLGRGLRRNPDLPFAEDVLDVFTSADTAVADQIRELEATYKTYQEDGSEEDAKTTGPGSLKIPELMVLDANWYRTDKVAPRYQPLSPPEWMVRAAEAENVPVDLVARLLSYMPQNSNGATTVPPTPSERQRLAYYQEQVTLATRRIAGHCVRILCGPYAFQKEWLAVTIRAINSEWIRKHGRHSEMLADDFQRKHAWLKLLTEEINRDGVPLWIIAAVSRHA